MEEMKKKMKKLAAEMQEWQDDYRQIPFPNDKENSNLLELTSSMTNDELQHAITMNEHLEELRMLRQLHRVTARLSSSSFEQFSLDSPSILNDLRHQVNEFADKKMIDRSMALRDHRQLKLRKRENSGDDDGMVHVPVKTRKSSGGPPIPSTPPSTVVNENVKAAGQKEKRSSNVASKRQLFESLAQVSTVNQRMSLKKFSFGKTISARIKDLEENKPSPKKLSSSTTTKTTATSPPKPPPTSSIPLEYNDTKEMEFTVVSELSSSLKHTMEEDNCNENSISMRSFCDEQEDEKNKEDENEPLFVLRKSISCGELSRIRPSVNESSSLLRSPSKFTDQNQDDEENQEEEENVQQQQSIAKENLPEFLEPIVPPSRRMSFTDDDIFSPPLTLKLSRCPQSSILLHKVDKVITKPGVEEQQQQQQQLLPPPQLPPRRQNAVELQTLQNIRDEILRLSNVIGKENSLIDQFTKALMSIRCSTNQHGFGIASTPYIESSRLLCMAVQRRNAAMNVLAYLKKVNSTRDELATSSTAEDEEEREGEESLCLREKIIRRIRMKHGNYIDCPFESSLIVNNISIQLKSGYTLAPLSSVPGWTTPLHLVYTQRSPEQHLLLLSFRSSDCDQVLFSEIVNIIPTSAAGVSSTLECKLGGGNLSSTHYVDIPTTISLDHVTWDMDLIVDVYLMCITRSNSEIMKLQTLSAASSSATASPFSKKKSSDHGGGVGNHKNPSFLSNIYSSPSPSVSSSLMTSSTKSKTQSTAAQSSSKNKFLDSLTKKLSSKKPSFNKKVDSELNLSPSQMMGVFSAGRFADHENGLSGSLRSTAFTNVSQLMLNLDNFHHGEYLLPNIPHHCPLTGLAKFKIDVFHEPMTFMQNYVNFYHEINGLMAWTMFWCVLYGDNLLLWPDRESCENDIDPKITIPISQCASDFPIGRAPQSITGRPNTLLFYWMEKFDDVDNNSKSGAAVDNLIQRRVGDWIVHKCLMSFNNADVANLWRNEVNKTLSFLRHWSQDKFDVLNNLYKAASDSLLYF